MSRLVAGFSRAKPPTIRKVDLGNAEEVVGLLDDVKYVFYFCPRNSASIFPSRK